ncbi:class I SAM-dependent methyltransferase [Tsukamurella serpentis]
MPAADCFPPAASEVSGEESGFPLAMDLCAGCGLAQLADDDTVTDEPRGVEPRALREQAADAVARVRAAGLLTGSTVREFASPHGGTWLPLLAQRGFTVADATTPADLVLDSFGIMHEPDQQAAFAARAAATAPGGILLLQYQSLGSIVQQRQWTALRHGHFGYYTLTALVPLLAAAGMTPVRAFEFDLYGGTVLVAARHIADPPAGDDDSDGTVEAILRNEAARRLTEPAGLLPLAQAPYEQAGALRRWAERVRRRGGPAHAYGAASRAVALFALAGLNRDLIAAVADASPAKQRRRMPGTDIPIVAPQSIAGGSGPVFLTLPDLADEVTEALPALRGRLVTEREL